MRTFILAMLICLCTLRAEAANLTVTVQNVSNNSCAGTTGASGVTVFRFNSSGTTLLDSRTTNSSGQATWTGITAGTYLFDVFSSPNYWVKFAPINVQEPSTPATLPRREPYMYDFQVLNATTNANVTGGTVPPGTPLKFRVRVRNCAPQNWNVQAQVIIDRDNAAPFDYEPPMSPTFLINSNSGIRDYDFGNFTPTATGTYNRYVSVQTSMSGTWVGTGSSTWAAAFTVANTTSFGGKVYDCNNSQIGIAGANISWCGNQTTTNSSGNYSFSGLPCQSCTLTVSKPGYTTFSQPNYNPTCNASNQKDVQLCPNTGNVSATVRAVQQPCGNGLLMPNTQVNRWTNTTPWQYIDSRTTNASGVATWSGITAGTYNFDVVMPGAETWTIASATVTAGQTAEPQLTRNLPYTYDFRVFSGGNDVTGQSVAAGTPLVFRVYVRNCVPSLRNTKVTLRLDDNGAAPFVYENTSLPQVINGNNSTGFFDFPVTLTTPGQYGRQIETLTFLDTASSGFFRTDAWWDWVTAITITPPVTQAPTLVDAGLNVLPQFVESGNTVTVQYRINNPNSVTVPVCLGCSIHLGASYFGGAPWIDSPAQDVVVNAPPGISNHSRQFVIPSTAFAGPYTVRYALRPVSGNLCNFVGTIHDSRDGDGLSGNPPGVHVKRPLFGTTVITHGFQRSGDTSGWVRSMGRAIVERAGGGTVLQYNPQSGRWERPSDAPVNDPNYDSRYFALDRTKELVLIFDWSQESNILNYDGNNGIAEAAADALYAALRQPLFPNGGPQGNQLSNLTDLFVGGRRMHLIGHSRGTSVNSEAAKRLLLSGRPIAQFTTLDPVAVGTVGIAGIGLVTVNDPIPRVWSGVTWADNYRQTVHDTCLTGICDAVFCNGGQSHKSLHLNGAFNVDLDVTTSGVNHCQVHTWYHGTIKLGALNDGDSWWSSNEPILAAWYPTTSTQQSFEYGYHFTDVVGNWTTCCPPANARPAFLNPTDPQTTLPTSSEELPATLYNGSFELGSGQRAGWSYHGGQVQAGGQIASGYLIMNPLLQPSVSVTHNRSWVDDSYSFLRIEYTYPLPGWINDTIKISLLPVDGGAEVTLLEPETLPGPGGVLLSRTVSVPAESRNRTYRLRVTAQVVGLPIGDGAINIHNITFVSTGAQLPAAPTNVIATPQTMCLGGVVTLSAAPPPTNVEIDWYQGTCNGSYVGTGNSIQVSPIVPMEYVARSRNTVNGAVSAACGGPVGVAVFLDPSVSISGNQTICAGQSATLTASGSAGTGNCVYQWQQSASGCSGTWSNIPDATSAMYNTGPLTATRSYRALYSCSGSGCDQAVSTCTTVTVSCTTYSGPPGGSWNVAANWPGGNLPTSSMNVTIPVPVVVSGSAQAQSVQITNGGDLIIGLTGTLTVGQCVVVADGGSLTLNQPDASMQCQCLTLNPNSSLKPVLSGWSGQPMITTATATINGTMQVALLNSYSPSPGQLFQPVVAGTLQGVFAATQLPNLPCGRVLHASISTNSVQMYVLPSPDINCDGVIGVSDLLAVISAWGACAQPCPAVCPADVAPSGGDCQVGVSDLLAIISNWG